MSRTIKLNSAARTAIAMAAGAALIAAALIAPPILTIVGMSASLTCGPGFGSGTQVSLVADGTSIPTLPQETIDYLDGRDVKDHYQENMERYLAAQEAEGVPAAVMAALHYREAGMNPESSISDGSPLGSGVNVDGINVVGDANLDAIRMAQHFKRMAQYVYGIDVVNTPMTTELWGQAFLAYNRGFLYERAGTTYLTSPYVMNGIDANHLNMSWGAGDTVKGVDGNKAGALAVMFYLGGAATASGVGLCTSGGIGKIQTPLVADTVWVTSGFDFRVRSNGVRKNHNGIDLVGGTQVVAAMSGTVTLARYWGGYGYAVVIDHGNGIETLYGHLKEDSTLVIKNQVVSAGQPLGTMGNTGDSEGDHLHFEYHKDGIPINPFPILKEQGINLVWQAGAYPKNEKPGPQD